MMETIILHCGDLGDVDAIVCYDEFGDIIDVILRGVVLSPQMMAKLVDKLSNSKKAEE